MSTIIDIDHAALKLGGNYRTVFNAEKMSELKGSIREHGIQQNLIGYRDPENPDVVLVIAGERRFRATGELLADLEKEGLKDLADKRRMVPVKIIPPEGVPYAKELQLIENLQREDITPLDEANGYHDMLTRLNPATDENYTIRELAAKLSVEETYIQRRLKLRRAPGALLAAVDQKQVSASVAELVGRIPDAASREAAAKEVLKPQSQEAPLNHEQAKALIQERYMVSLTNDCPFDRHSAELLPVRNDADGQRECGGSCDDCPFRSGNMPELQDKVAGGEAGRKKGGKTGGIDANICTNPACYRLKVDAHWRQLKAARMDELRKQADAETDPKEKTKMIEALADRFIIEGDRAKKVFGGHGGEIAYDSPYGDADEKPGGERFNYDWQAAEKAPKWRELAKQAGVPLVIAKNPHSGKVVMLVEEATVIEKLKEKAKQEGKKSLFDVGGSNGAGAGGEAEKKRKKAELEKSKIETAKAHLGAAALLEALGKKGLDAEGWEIAFLIALSHAGADGQWFLAKWLGLEAVKKDYSRDFETPILEHVRKVAVDNATIWQNWVVCALVLKYAKHSGISGDDYVVMAKYLSIDCKKLEAEAKAQIEAKKIKKPVKLKPGAVVPASEANGGKPAPKKKSAAKKTPPKKPAAKKTATKKAAAKK